VFVASRRRKSEEGTASVVAILIGVLLIAAIVGEAAADVSICATAPEHQAAELACPSGYLILEIEYAKYGLPDGECGAFDTTSCGSTISKQVVTEHCLGQPGCQVPAENTLFGDPCPGVKRISVQVRCGVPD
jgi:hypothetical protein